MVVVLFQLPAPLDDLDEVLVLVDRFADAGVVVEELLFSHLAGGRDKTGDGIYYVIMLRAL